MLSFAFSGSFHKLESFLKAASKLDVVGILETYGKQGVAALELVTPVDTGLAAISWGYEVSSKNGVHTLTWTNSDIERGFPVVIMLQYGYGTGSGGYVRGRNFINPALRPIFDKIAADVWKAVTSA